MLDREFFLGFIKIHILYHASKEPIFGAEMTRELARHGYNISPGNFTQRSIVLKKKAI